MSWILSKQTGSCLDCDRPDLATQADFDSRMGNCPQHKRMYDSHCSACRAQRHNPARQPRCKDCNKNMCRRRRRLRKMRALVRATGLSKDSVKNTDGSCRTVVLTGLLHAPDPQSLLAALRALSGEGDIHIDDAAALSPISATASAQQHVQARIHDAPPEGERGQTFARFVDLHATAGGLDVVSIPEPAGYVDTGGVVAPGEFVIGVRGRSMHPSIPDGSQCLFEEAEFDDSLNGSIVLAQGRDGFDPEGGGRYTVKRLAIQHRKRRGLLLALLPENTAFEPIYVEPGEEVAIVAVYRRLLGAG